MILDELIPQSTPLGTAYLPVEPGEVRLSPSMSDDDKAALKIVVQDSIRAESWVETKGLLLEWMRADRLYLFQVPTQFWDGTDVPRSNLGMPLVYEHVESILPQVMIGLFSDDPPFMLKPRPGTSAQVARANTALLSWELDRTNFREEIRLGLKSAAIYGTGIWKWGWKSSTTTRKIRKRRTPNQFVGDAIGGVSVRGSDETEMVEVRDEINEPTFEAINLRHILVDPGLRTSDIRKARFVIHRMYLTASDLMELKDDPSYKNLPESEKKLLDLFFPPIETPVPTNLETQPIDINRDFKATPRYLDPSVDPRSRPLLVEEYWTKDRVYTVIQRKLVIRNEVHNLGGIPFLSVAYADVLDSFYGLGIARLVGNEQRMQQGVINAFLDDLSLSLNGMVARRRGANVPTQQLRTRPGGIIDVDVAPGENIQNALTPIIRTPIPVAETAAVLAASDSRAQRRTAANELVVQGTLPSQGSSITRTATGVQALTGGSGARLQYLIENIADQVFVPALEAFHRLNAERLKPSQIELILSQELGQAYDGDSLDLINGNYDFYVVAASKLQARRGMLQTLPMLYQFILTEPVLESLSEQGKKVNVAEMVNMLFDVTGYPNKQDVIVEMSDEDKQRAMMNNPAVQQMIAQQQKSQTDQGNKLQAIEEENIGRAGRDVIQTILKKSEMEGIQGEKKAA